MREDFYTERIAIAFIIGVGGGILAGNYFGDYLFWIIILSVASFAVETITRSNKPLKELEKQEKEDQKNYNRKLMAGSEVKFKPPKPPKFKPPKGL